MISIMLKLMKTILKKYYVVTDSLILDSVGFILELLMRAKECKLLNSNMTP
jgi:hypothetical protein